MTYQVLISAQVQTKRNLLCEGSQHQAIGIPAAVNTLG